MRDTFYVYMMTSTNRDSLYIGVTNSLRTRVLQHRRQDGTGFTARYHALLLVHFESYRDARAAIARETQLKKWRRGKKDFLIAMKNPTWRDLAPEIVDELPRIDDAVPPEEMV